MRSIPIEQAAGSFPQLLAKAEAGEEISLTRNGRIVARLAPAGLRQAAMHHNWDESRRALDAAVHGLGELISPLD